MSELLGIKEVASILGVSRNEIPGYVEKGLLRSTCFPGQKRLRFTRQAVDEFILRCTTTNKDGVDGPDIGPIAESGSVQAVEKRGQLKRPKNYTKMRPYEWMVRATRK